MRCSRSFAALSIALAASGAFAQSTVMLDATSGTGTISTNFTTTGGLTLNLGFFSDYLVVGGGGGGGGATGSLRGAGGGGAGGVVTGTSTPLSAINYSVLVGAGGAGGANSSTNASRQGQSGTNSAFGSFTATGGGGGGAGGNDSQFVGSAGGSGGGAGGGGNSSVSGTTGGSGTTGQGTSGGASVNNTATNPNGSSSNRWAGGGGGGAGSAGSQGDQAPGNSGNATGGSGGAGTASSISGSSVIYAGGGGGGAVATASFGSPTNTAGTGGAGGGGNGGSGNSGSSGANGVNGLGGGGGGAASSGTGGNGGSGLVIVRYQGASLGNIGGTVTTGSGSAAGYTIHTFTTTGSTNFDMSGVNMNARLATTLTGTISGSGGLTFAGPGRLTLSGSNTYSGGTTLSGGTLVGTSASLQGNISTAAGTGVTFNEDSQDPSLILFFYPRYSGNLSGGGSLTKTGTGFLYLLGTNSYSGGTTVSAGVLAGTADSLQGNIATSSSTTVWFLAPTSMPGTYSGSVSGAGAMRLGLGSWGGSFFNGTLTLTGSNTFAGGVALTSGTLALGSANALGSIGTIDLTGGALQFSASNTTDYSGRFSTAAEQKYALDTNGQNVTLASALTSAGGSLTKTGAGTLTLTGSNSYSGGTTLSGGTLVGTSLSLQGDIAVAAGTGVTFTQATSGTYAGILSGAGSLTKWGSGALTLSGNNSYSGGTTLASGSLVGTSSSLQGNIEAFGGTVVTFDQATTGTYAGIVRSSGGLRKSGAGTLTLTGSNNYSGNTTVSSGTLVIGGAGSLGQGLGSASYLGEITNDGSLVFASSADQTVTTVIKGSGSITKSGAGVLRLSGVNPYLTIDRQLTVMAGSFFAGRSGDKLITVGETGTGTLNVSGGDVTCFGAGIGFGSGGVGTTNVTGGVWTNYGTLYVGYVGTGTLNVSGGSVVNSGAVIGEFAGSVGTATVTGGTWANSDSLVVGRSGSGTLTIRDGGRVIVGGVLAKGSGGTINLDAGGTLQIGTGGTTGELSTNPVNNGTLVFNRSNNFTVVYAISGSGSLVKQGAGSLTLTGSNTYSGGTTLSAGSLVGTSSSLQGNIVSAAGTGITFNQGAAGTYAGNISGAGSLTKIGAGTLTLSGNNSYSGGTTLSTGSLVGTSSSLQGNIATSAGTGVTFNQAATGTYAGNLSGRGTLSKLGVGSLTLSGSNSFTGQTTVGAGTLVLGSGNALASTAAVVVNAGATLQATTPIRIGYIDSQGTVVGGENLSATLTVTRSGNIGGIANGTDSQGTFAAGIVKLGTGTSTVNQANTYTGLTWVREGTLAMGVSNAFAAASDLTVDSGATFDRAGSSQTVTDAVINGTVANAGGGGLLAVSGTLSGTGVLNGNVTVAGVHAPGNSSGLQTFTGDLTYAVAAAVEWELLANSTSDAGTNYDQIAMPTGNLTFSGSTTLDLSFDGPGSTVDWTDTFWDANRAWTIYDLGTGTTTGFANLVLGGSLLDSLGNTLSAERGAFSMSQIGQDVFLNYTVAAIPEPATVTLALAGLACGGFSMWRRRKRA